MIRSRSDFYDAVLPYFTRDREAYCLLLILFFFVSSGDGKWLELTTEVRSGLCSFIMGCLFDWLREHTPSWLGFRTFVLGGLLFISLSPSGLEFGRFFFFFFWRPVVPLLSIALGFL